MANPNLYQPGIELTPKGAKVELSKIYVYPDGHANIVFADGRNWPLANQYEVIEALAELLRKMERAAVSRTV